MSDELQQRIVTYQDSLTKHGESPKALKWRSYQAAAQRYKQLVADLDVTNKSILDAGCGMGDLLPFLYANGGNFQYLGVDINQAFIEIAKKRYAGHDFQILNPFGEALKQQFDIIISSGVLNASTPNWQNERKVMIEHLFKHCDEALAFNMAGWTQESSAVKNIGYANMQGILMFCETLTSKLILRNHYNDKDFTIVLFR